jgi:hypothetical protein
MGQTEDNPCLITNCNELDAIHYHLDLNKPWPEESNDFYVPYFSLAQDINCSDTREWYDGNGFEPIGTCGPDNACYNENYSYSFTASFDGNNHTISGLYINRPDLQYTGLFGVIEPESRISNLSLSDVNIIGLEQVGGIVGFNEHSTIENTSVTGQINGTNYIGGVVGVNRGTVKNSHFIGEINAASLGGYGVGGLVGFNSDLVFNSYSDANVLSDGQVTGCFVGVNQGTILKSYSKGSVTSSRNNTGGFEGMNNYAVTKNSYSTCNVNGQTYTGGFAATSMGPIVNSYFAGTLSGSLLGGFLSINDGGDYSGNFWDTNTTEQLIGVNYGPSEGITGKTTEEMKTQSTFTDANWDFEEIWDINAEINDGYPFLRWQFSDSLEDFVRDVEISTDFNLTQAYDSDSIDINITITNLGDIDFETGYFYLELYIDDVRTDSTYVALPDIGESSIHTVTISSKSLEVGAHTFYIRLIDSSYLSPDDNETNNYTPVFDLNMMAGPYYPLATLEDLNAIREHLTRNYVLVADINAYPTREWNLDEDEESATYGQYLGFEPIGVDWDNLFAGNIDGNGYTISGLYINRPEQDEAGLVGMVYPRASFNELALTDATIIGGSSVGGLVGACYGDCAFIKTKVDGSLTGTYSVGGLTGYVGNEGPSDINIFQSSFEGTITSSEGSAGGLVGQLSAYEEDEAPIATIQESYARATINADESSGYAGGLVGNYTDYSEYNKALTLIDTYAVIDIERGYYAGGLVGYAEDSDVNIQNSYADGEINNCASYGGLIGFTRDLYVTNSFTTVSVKNEGEEQNGILLYSADDALEINNFWWYNEEGITYPDEEYEGVNKANAYSDFYDPANTPLNAWDFNNVWFARDNNYPALRMIDGNSSSDETPTAETHTGGGASPDKDKDGVADYKDTLLYTESKVKIVGINDLNILVGGKPTTENPSGLQEVVVEEGTRPLMVFNFDFGTGVLDLSKISIEKSENGLVVDLNGQLQDGQKKTLYLENKDFKSLCVKDAPITTIGEITSTCTGEGEYNFTQCLNGNYSTEGINCSTTNGIIKVENLIHSGVLGIPADKTPSTNTIGPTRASIDQNKKSDANILLPNTENNLPKENSAWDNLLLLLGGAIIIILIIIILGKLFISKGWKNSSQKKSLVNKLF